MCRLSRMWLQWHFFRSQGYWACLRHWLSDSVTTSKPGSKESQYPLISVRSEPGILVHRKAIIIIAFTHRAGRWQKCIIPLNCIARRRYPWPHLSPSLSFDFFRGSQLIPPKNPLFWGRVAVSVSLSVMPRLPRGGGVGVGCIMQQGVVMCTTWTQIMMRRSLFNVGGK